MRQSKAHGAKSGAESIQELTLVDDGVEVEVLLGSGPEIASALQTKSVERKYTDLLRDIRKTKGNVAFIQWIAANTPGQGSGSAVISRLLNKFDNEMSVGTTFLQLSSANLGDGVARRRRFFERHGFVPHVEFDAMMPRQAMKRHSHLVRVNSAHLPGARSTGMRPQDFDPTQLLRGTRHELEHTTNRDIAQGIAMDHLAENAHYYEMLAEMERLYPRANGEIESQYIEFPRHIAEQVKHLRPQLWQRHGTGGNPPTAWTGDNAYKAWAWWIALRTGRRVSMSDVPVAQEAYAILTNNDWRGDYASLFKTVVELWLRKRENYVTRHASDFQQGGTIAMIKWAAVFPWAEEKSPGQGYKHMLATLGLTEENGVVREMAKSRLNGRVFRVT
jgi:hypothetical protein